MLKRLQGNCSCLFYSQEFQKIYKQFFPFGDPSKFASFVFNVFDENKVNILTEHEFPSEKSPGLVSQKFRKISGFYFSTNVAKLSHRNMLC